MIEVGKDAVFTVLDESVFCRPYLQNGASCEVLEVNPNTALVQFNGQEDTDIVSLSFLR